MHSRKNPEMPPQVYRVHLPLSLPERYLKPFTTTVLGKGNTQNFQVLLDAGS